MIPNITANHGLDQGDDTHVSVLDLDPLFPEGAKPRSPAHLRRDGNIVNGVLSYRALDRSPRQTLEESARGWASQPAVNGPVVVVACADGYCCREPRLANPVAPVP